MVGSVIKSLILQGKRVIIPDFGAFLIKDGSANPILTKENVTFSPFLRYNDGFLELEVAHTHNLHKDEANIKVAEYVHLIKSTLFEKDALFHVNGVGYFYNDGKGNTCFSIELPAEAAHFESASSESKAAQTSVEKEPLEVVKLKEESSKSNEIEDIAESNKEKVATNLREEHPFDGRVEIKHNSSLTDNDVAEIEKEEEKENVITIGSTNNIPPSKRFSRGLLVGFILLIVCLFSLNVFWSDIFGAKSEQEKTQIILDPIDQERVVEEKNKIEAKERVQDAISNEVVSTVEKAVQSSSKPKDKESTPNSVAAKKKEEVSKKEESKAKEGALADGYVIVLGSFGTAENAQKHVQELSKRNIKAKVVVRSKMSSVISGDYKTYDEAKAAQSRIKALGFDGWITRK